MESKSKYNIIIINYPRDVGRRTETLTCSPASWPAHSSQGREKKKPEITYQ